MACTLLSQSDAHFDQDNELYRCDECGNIWDGNAQCLCGMFSYDNYDIEDIQDEDIVAEKNGVTLRQIIENEKEIKNRKK